MPQAINRLSMVSGRTPHAIAAATRATSPRRAARSDCRSRRSVRKPDLVGARRQLAREVQAARAEAALVPLFLRQHPEHLELVAIGVFGVQAEAVAVVAFADQGAAGGEGFAGMGEVLNGGHLP